MSNRYEFAPYDGGRGKINCPHCGSKKSWTLYVDTKTNTLLPDTYGICDKINKCPVYHNSPYFNPPNQEDYKTGKVVKIPPKDRPHNLISKKILDKSLENQYRDNFSIRLIRLFGKKAIEALNLYKVGASTKFMKHETDFSTVFWQIDPEGNIRSGKIMKYGMDGHRVKADYPLISWAHSDLKDDFVLKQTFFGAHLLKKYPDKRVMVVESEKSSVISSIVRPKFLWLASSALEGLQEHKLELIKDRKVMFLPDKGFYNKWKEKIEVYNNKNWEINDFLENTNIVKQGDDIVDYLEKTGN